MTLLFVMGYLPEKLVISGLSVINRLNRIYYILFKDQIN